VAGNRWPGVFKRGKGWAFRAQFEAEGKRWGVSGSGYETAKEAAKARATALEEARARAGNVDRTTTLAAYLNAWLAGHSETIRPGSASTYKARVDVISRHPLAQRKLVTLSEADYRRMVGDWRKDAAHSTLTGRVTTLKAALSAAVRAGLISANPLDHVHVSRTQERPVAAIWDRETALAFLAHRRAAEDPLYAAWHVALVTGLRRGELHGIRREDVDLTNCLLYVRRQRYEVRSHVFEGPPKTEGSSAPVYLDEGTCALLRDHPWPESGYLVTDPRTQRPYRTMKLFLKDWQKACSDAGAPRIRFHDLRHTSASLLAAAGVPLSAAQRRLRHWSPRMTAAYTQVADSTQAQVARQIGALLELEPAP
jgi:integrase